MTASQSGLGNFAKLNSDIRFLVYEEILHNESSIDIIDLNFLQEAETRYPEKWTRVDPRLGTPPRLRDLTVLFRLNDDFNLDISNFLSKHPPNHPTLPLYYTPTLGIYSPATTQFEYDFNRIVPDISCPLDMGDLIPLLFKGFENFRVSHTKRMAQDTSACIHVLHPPLIHHLKFQPCIRYDEDGLYIGKWGDIDALQRLLDTVGRDVRRLDICLEERECDILFVAYHLDCIERINQQFPSVEVRLLASMFDTYNYASIHGGMDWLQGYTKVIDVDRDIKSLDYKSIADMEYGRKLWN